MKVVLVSSRISSAMRLIPSFSALPLCAALLGFAPLRAQTPPATTPPAAGTPGAPAATPAGTPTTAAATTAAPTTALATGDARSGRASWTADRRNFVVGDIITVLIDDYTVSTAVKENSASDSRTRGLSATVHMPAGSKGGGIDSRNSADQQQRGSAKRENRFQNELSVRIIALGANGLLQVKGQKKIDVDKAQQDIVFTGWLRAQDITTQNTVESSRVADAQIGYASPGPLGTPKQSMLGKLLGALWP